MTRKVPDIQRQKLRQKSRSSNHSFHARRSFDESFLFGLVPITTELVAGLTTTL
jgi:hypothetical protein